MVDIRLLSLLRKGKEEKNFEIIDITMGKIPDGLSPQILQALWQICLCFGQQKDNVFGFRYGSENNDFIIEIIFVDGVENHHCFAIKKPGAVIKENFEGYNWLGLNTSIFVLWDEKIDPKDIEKSIMKIDAIALQNGQIINGQRTKNSISCQEAAQLCDSYN